MGWAEMDYNYVLDIALRWLIPAVCAGITGWAAAQVAHARAVQKAEDRKAEAVRLGVQALLRDRLIWAHDHYMQKGCYPIYARENVEEMYTRYHALGGNGTVTSLVRELDGLPTSRAEAGAGRREVRAWYTARRAWRRWSSAGRASTWPAQCRST